MTLFYHASIRIEIVCKITDMDYSRYLRLLHFFTQMRQNERATVPTHVAIDDKLGPKILQCYHHGERLTTRFCSLRYHFASQ